MGQHIPLPAETLRRMASGASDEVFEERANGRRHNAKRLQEHISIAMDLARGNDGEFVSVPANVVSNLVSFGAFKNVSRDYHDGARQFLEQYDIWG